MTSDFTASVPRSFTFGPFVLVPGRQALLHHGEPVRLGGRALDILTLLVTRPGELVTKRELMATVWPETVVEESNLKVHVAALRRALDDLPASARYIATVTGRGYRFVAPVMTREPRQGGLGDPVDLGGPGGLGGLDADEGPHGDVDRVSVSELYRRLDGLALAIERAATRIGSDA